MMIGLAAGTLTTTAFAPQLVKAWRGMLVTFSTGILLWLIYGVWIDSVPVILANAVTLLLQAGIVSLKIKHG